MEKKTPMLDPKKKNEQNIEKQDSPKEPNSKPEAIKKPKKEDPKKVPESNDPAGYGESEDVKEAPFKKK
ncbi:MAG TPA: hypothetical protein DHV22_00415 [Xanthomarina gelatinilytica]|jgi:hypothetical protein|uniref:Uncharacterized protein n=1 Tax=Xanthomarina gelatinilytica TaxID=1137281 RepID=A0A3D6BLL4_9FLAO|nr:hypothetical protein [Xanthomarina gelatinilytica]